MYLANTFSGLSSAILQLIKLITVKGDSCIAVFFAVDVSLLAFLGSDLRLTPLVFQVSLGHVMSDEKMEYLIDRWMGVALALIRTACRPNRRSKD